MRNSIAVFPHNKRNTIMIKKNTFISRKHMKYIHGFINTLLDEFTFRWILVEILISLSKSSVCIIFLPLKDVCQGHYGHHAKVWIPEHFYCLFESYTFSQWQQLDCLFLNFFITIVRDSVKKRWYIIFCMTRVKHENKMSKISHILM